MLLRYGPPNTEDQELVWLWLLAENIGQFVRSFNEMKWEPSKISNIMILEFLIDFIT